MLVLAYVAVVLLFGRFVLRAPQTLLRPSVWFSLCMIVNINAGAALASVDGDADLEHNAVFRLLAIVFPLGVLLWVLFSPRLTSLAGEVSARCRIADLPNWQLSKQERYFTTLLGAVAVIVLLAYCGTVSLDRLGLNAIISQRSDAAMAREESLKLLDSDWLRYGYSLHVCLFGPLLACVAMLWAPPKARWLALPVVGLLTVSVMLSGARSAAGMLLVGLGISYLLRKGIRRGFVAVAMAGVIAMLVATLLSVYREASADSLDLGFLLSSLTGGIAERVFVIPFEMGVANMAYAQEHGLLGIQNIRPLALLLGYDYVNLPNEVFREFYAYRFVMAVDSGYANCCFLFDLQASFGMAAGWLVSLVLLALLDGALYWFRRLPPGILIGCLAAFLLGVFSLISGNYTTCLISNGMLPTLMLAGAYLQFFSPRATVRPVPGARRPQGQLRVVRQ